MADSKPVSRTFFVAAEAARIEAEQVIWRLGPDDAPQDELWRALVFAAVLDTAGRPRRLPASVRDAMAPLVSPRGSESGQ